MAKHQRGVRLIIGSEPQTLTRQEMQQREIMRIARTLVRLERERRKIRKRLKQITSELRLLRRAQRIVLAPVFQPEEFDSEKVQS
jgi:hypothetical protein